MIAERALARSGSSILIGRLLQAGVVLMRRSSIDPRLGGLLELLKRWSSSHLLRVLLGCRHVRVAGEEKCLLGGHAAWIKVLTGAPLTSGWKLPLLN